MIWWPESLYEEAFVSWAIFLGAFVRALIELVEVLAVVLMGFGTYWIGEGLDFGWPGGMLSLIWLSLLWGLLLAGAATFLRARRRVTTKTRGLQTHGRHEPPGGRT